jgi:hypothetical protein
MQPRRRGRDPEFVTPRLAYGFVGLVAGSAGLMAAANDATLVEVGLLSAVGLVVGVAVLLAIGIRPWTAD